MTSDWPGDDPTVFAMLFQAFEAIRPDLGSRSVTIYRSARAMTRERGGEATLSEIVRNAETLAPAPRRPKHPGRPAETRAEALARILPAVAEVRATKQIPVDRNVGEAMGFDAKYVEKLRRRHEIPPCRYL